MEVDWSALPSFVGGFLLLAVAVGILMARPSHTVHRHVAMIFGAWGFLHAIRLLTPGQTALAWERTAPYFYIFLAAATLRLATVTLATHGRPTRRFPAGIIWAIGAFFLLLYAMGPRSDATAWRTATGVVWMASSVWTAFRLARAARHCPGPHHRMTLECMAAALLTIPAFLAPRVTTLFPLGSQTIANAPWWAVAGVTLTWLATAFGVIAGAAYLAVRSRRLGLAATVSATVVLGIAATTGLELAGLAGAPLVLTIVATPIRLVAAVLMVYALLHARWLRIHLWAKRLAWVVVLPLSFAALTLLAAEVLEAFTGSRLATTLAAIAVLIWLVTDGLRRLERGLDRIWPHVAETPEYLATRHNVQYMVALEDAHATASTRLDAGRLVSMRAKAAPLGAEAAALERTLLG